MLIEYFSGVKFIFTRGRIKTEFFIQTQSLKFWSHCISILSEGWCKTELCEGIRSRGWKMKTILLNIFILPVLWDQFQFLQCSPLLSVGRGDKVDPLLENIKVSLPSCSHLCYLLFECHVSGIRSEWLCLPHMPDGGACSPDPDNAALVEAKADFCPPLCSDPQSMTLS